MAPRLTRSSLHSSPLVRLLDGWAGPGGAEAPSASIADQLGQWMAWTDAIALSSALGAGEPAPQAAPPLPPAARALIDEVARARRDLTQAISMDTALQPSPAQPTRSNAPPAATPAITGHDTGSAEASRQACQRLQRAAAERLQPLRERLRSALAARSPALRQLATVDAVLDQALAAREQHLLGSLPGWLARRQRATEDADAAAPPADLRALLLADLTHRLLPIDGLADALAASGPGRP